MEKFSGYIDFNGRLTNSRIYKNEKPHGEVEICKELIELLRTNKKDWEMPTIIELYPEYTDGDGKWENMEYKRMKKTLILGEDVEIFLKYNDEEIIEKDQEIGPDIISYSTKIPLRYIIFLYYLTFIKSEGRISSKEWKLKTGKELKDVLESHQKAIKEEVYIQHEVFTVCMGEEGLFVIDIGS
jgi:hypothetical protein